MRVVECAEFGPVDGLRVLEREDPPLRAGAVRIEVAASGVNHVDGLFVQGRYQIRPPLPFVPGSEIAGRIVELAPDVAEQGHWQLGDRVIANVGLGGFATQAVVDADRLVSVPDALTDAQAATFMQSYLTGWFALSRRAHAASGQTMVVLGAGGGVGLAAVDLGVAIGMRVAAVASSDEKLSLATARGAEERWNSSERTVDEIKDAARAFGATTGRHGVDVLYDPVGGELGEVGLRALGENGQYLVVGFVAGIPRLAANQVLLRNRRVIGVDWGAWAMANPAANAELLDEVLAMIAEGRLSPVEPIERRIEEVASVLSDLESRRIAGKVVLVP